MRPRRIEVEIGRLVVDDPAQARRGEVAVALERELGRLAADGHELSAQTVRKAIAHAVGRELVR